jgi:hypothetical protein
VALIAPPAAALAEGCGASSVDGGSKVGQERPVTVIVQMAPDQADMLHAGSRIDIQWFGEIDGQTAVRLVCEQAEVLEVPANPVEPWIGDPDEMSPGKTEKFVVLPLTLENIARMVQASSVGQLYATISD